MSVDPTLQPIITLVQAPNQFRETSPGLFQASTLRLSFRVDYSQIASTSAIAGKLSDVLADMHAQNYQLYIGRAVALGGVPSPSPLVAYPGLYAADATDGESSIVEPWIVRSMSGSTVPGSTWIWHVDVDLSLVGYQNAYERIQASVVASSGTRVAQAFRLGDLNLLTDDTAEPKLGAVSSPTPLPGQCGSVTATTGSYDQSNWITYDKATMDVGGEEVDINGQPIGVPIEQLNYTLQFVIRKPNFGSGSEIIPGGPASPSGYGTRVVGCMWSLWGIYPQWILNKRNRTALFGYEPGELVCTSVTHTPIDDEFILCSVTLTWDEWGHCDQVPWGFNGSIPPTAEKGATGDRAILNADTVYWMNPHQESFNITAADFPRGAHALFEEMILVPS